MTVNYINNKSLQLNITKIVYKIAPTIKIERSLVMTSKSTPYFTHYIYGLFVETLSQSQEKEESCLNIKINTFQSHTY